MPQQHEQQQQQQQADLRIFAVFPVLVQGCSLLTSTGCCHLLVVTDDFYMSGCVFIFVVAVVALVVAKTAPVSENRR